MINKIYVYDPDVEDDERDEKEDWEDEIYND